MAALVQSYPQQSGTVTMLQTRPASASGILPSPQNQAGQQYGGSQQQRNSFYATPSGNGGTGTGYRGTSGPIQQYAFTSTPSLNPSNQWQQFGNMRTSSTPAVPTMQTLEQANGIARSRYPASVSMTNLPSTSSLGYATSGSRDDSALPGTRRVTPTPRPQSSYMTGSATQVTFTQATPIKISPDRYRRPAPRATDSSNSVQQAHAQTSAPPSGSGMATVGHLYTTRRLPEQKPGMGRGKTPVQGDRPNSYYASAPGSSVDDIQLLRQNAHEEAKRFRRRSMPALDSADYPKPLTPHMFKQPEDSSRPEQVAPLKNPDKGLKPVIRLVTANGAEDKTMHTGNGSSESLVSSHSSHSRPSSRPSSRPTSSRNANASAPTSNPTSHLPEQHGPSQDNNKSVNIPPRSSSSDVTSRVVNPSPLSKPVTMHSGDDDALAVAQAGDAANLPNNTTSSGRNGDTAGSPAVRQLAAISQKSGKLKSKTSRLRRALSFGSAAEFRKAGDPDQEGESSGGPGPSKLHKEPTADEIYDAEQARIAKKQEEGGIGNSIYAGARIFSGSTDNLSISSTASSASIMIRKMGRGMKKSTRSLVGLFRPKSVIGVPAADGPIPEASQAAVSMITVEAERELVNVNADPHAQNGGGTGFPRLERNSIDAVNAPNAGSERLGSSDTDNSGPRKSIVGGEKERAEVLAAVRKGILKKTSGASSPSRGPIDSRGPAFNLPNVPAMTESPASSAPSTPNDEVQGHKRTDSVAIGSEDYFMTALRLRQDTKSAPNTPQGTLKRNATFSPRIMFHDTWHSQEYDRRGEIATCNRLTPMLAQQIKEELNSFKMEMEVHENSKVYTHFF